MVDIVELLLKFGADPNMKHVTHGTAIEHACNVGAEHAIRALAASPKVQLRGVESCLRKYNLKTTEGHAQDKTGKDVPVRTPPLRPLSPAASGVCHR